jgi:hypothetical protein
MAKDSNGDVDRAMAAFAVSPMRYFTPAPTPPGNARATGAETSGSRQVSSDQTAAFPLLIAALPGINEALMPVPPVGTDTGSGKLPLEAKKVELPTRRARALDRPVAQPPKMMSSRQVEKAPNVSSVFGLPVRHSTSTQMASQPAPGPCVSNIRPTPIARMFHALSAADASHDEPAEIGSGLQDLFSRL